MDLPCSTSIFARRHIRFSEFKFINKNDVINLINKALNLYVQIYSRKKIFGLTQKYHFSNFCHVPDNILNSGLTLIDLNRHDHYQSLRCVFVCFLVWKLSHSG